MQRTVFQRGCMAPLPECAATDVDGLCVCVAMAGPSRARATPHPCGNGVGWVEHSEAQHHDCWAYACVCSRANPLGFAFGSTQPTGRCASAWGAAHVYRTFLVLGDAQWCLPANRTTPRPSASAPLLFSFWHNRCIRDCNPPRCSVWDALSINGDRLAANGPGTT